jgi:hypothetical protein
LKTITRCYSLSGLSYFFLVLGLSEFLPAPLGLSEALPAPLGLSEALPAPLGLSAEFPAPLGLSAVPPAPLGLSAELPAPLGLSAGFAFTETDFLVFVLIKLKFKRFYFIRLQLPNNFSQNNFIHFLQFQIKPCFHPFFNSLLYIQL